MSGPVARAQQQDARRAQDPTWVSSSGAFLTLFPSEEIYSIYVADPHRPTNFVAETLVIGGGVPGTRSPLTRLGAGGRFGIARFGSGQPGGRAWQISIEAGFDAMFDSQHRLDVIGWDGNYGFTFATASNSPLALKIAVLHVSGHVGDEHRQRTGRERVNYTREELSVGAALRLSPRWRTYVETAVAYRRGDPSLEPWRVQWGVEYDSGPGPCGQRFACYAATDFSAMEERDWRVDVTVEAGIAVRGGERTPRIFLEWHDGRPTVSDFFKDSVSTLGLGLKIDL